MLFTLIAVGMRIFMMLTLQQRQQRMNRQINERLKTLIAAYKVLGGSFTGKLEVDPSHLRELRQTPAEGELESFGSDRPRRIRDAVEAALSDILLLGTDEQVELAAMAANQMAAGEPIQTGELVVSLRNYIRKALDLGQISGDVTIPMQGPTRPSSSSGKSGAARDSRSGAKSGGSGGGMGLGIGAGGQQSDDGQTLV